MKKIFLAICLIIAIASKATEDKNTVNGELKAVTVYRYGAELTHLAHATIKQGNTELIITNIANNIDVNSIQIKTDNAVTILGVEFSNDYLVEKEKSSKVKALEDSIEKLQQANEKIELSILNINELIEVLKANKDIKGSQTGLSVTELAKLMDYYKTKMQELQDQKAQLNEKYKKNATLINKLQSQIQEEQNLNTSVSGRLILQLNTAISNKYDFTITYTTNHAIWNPNYDIKVLNTTSPITIITKAKISQTTGIDWKKVKLTLSTATPNKRGEIPTLNTWFVRYNQPIARKNDAYDYGYIAPQSPSLEKSLAGRVAGVQVDKDSRADIKLRGAASLKQNSKPLVVVDGILQNEDFDMKQIDANRIKKVDVLKDASATAIYGARGNNGVIIITLKNSLEDDITVSENTLNIVYELDIPYDVPTNGKEQIATISTKEVNATYLYSAVPKVDKTVFLIAEIADWNKLNLLLGEANVTFEGTYVGVSNINPNTTNDTLLITLGQDKRVNITREKLVDYSSVKFLGSNKLQKFAYEITVKNNKKDAIDINLKDQYPISTDKDIEVELIDDGNAEVNKETGLLKWNLKLAAGEVKTIKFSYSIKYSKDKSINL